MTTTTPTPSTDAGVKRAFYKRRGFLIGALILAIPTAALAWWLGSPLFLDTVVDEDFPTVTTPASVEDGAGAPASGDSVLAEDASQPVAVLTGNFAGADDFHEGSGTATIYELEDGSHILRFEDFEVTNGPDLHVLISETDSITTSEDLNAAGYVDLGQLKGNVGDQNYELPAGFDADGPVTITIYCEPFHVVFATATLSLGA